MLRWWRDRRRAKILASPFPDEWQVRLELDVALWRAIPAAAKPRLLDDLRLFMAERDWEPCGGIKLDDAMRAVIAAQACVLTLGRSVDAFDHVRSILVYPTSYRAPDVWEDDAGVVTEEIDEREGEAWERGIVVLSWQELAGDARALTGRNLVLHELAHQIDIIDVLTANPSRFEGGREEAVRRMDAFLAAYEALDREVEAGRRVKALDSYGAEDEAEFFAVATESFFERGLYLKTHHPELYDVLAWYYNQDPAAWPAPERSLTIGQTGRERRRQRREEERKLRKRRPG
ncbi:MAG TPA: zinc-dependent peptidase [Thermoanaerobaculales bacterium]|nr:zinc-dependent peptidase [Thermoanaerobaculales bacterium]HPA79484.1 zinc-dependent peptidase [Thermoanaerobaculales bacterium]HQL29703.1 zinc-dependent peptidase [Thermoanaerobaculales bacterium]HQN95437.1 zinc-dependent peptidase [Thermoanaerobaculales bacterium]HQP43569.1 zinc-dependent peptidase [Thermoanaerobaculales bacterium]